MLRLYHIVPPVNSDSYYNGTLVYWAPFYEVFLFPLYLCIPASFTFTSIYLRNVLEDLDIYNFHTFCHGFCTPPLSVCVYIYISKAIKPLYIEFAFIN